MLAYGRPYRGLTEVLLVGVAAKRPTETVGSLKMLNLLWAMIAGQPMDLPSSGELARGAGRTK
jgi:hypothetical protein